MLAAQCRLGMLEQWHGIPWWTWLTFLTMRSDVSLGIVLSLLLMWLHDGEFLKYNRTQARSTIRSNLFGTGEYAFTWHGWCLRIPADWILIDIDSHPFTIYATLSSVSLIPISLIIPISWLNRIDHSFQAFSLIQLCFHHHFKRHFLLCSILSLIGWWNFFRPFLLISQWLFSSKSTLVAQLSFASIRSKRPYRFLGPRLWEMA